MKIAVYGCSWCCGVPPSNSSWVKALAKYCPTHEFYNYSVGGSSLSYALYMFEKFRSNYDINIIKLTCPDRLTLINEEYDINNNRGFVNENYNTWLNDEIHNDNVVRLTASGLSPASTIFRSTAMRNLHKLYYTNFNTTMAEIEANAIVEYLKTQADFVYCHRAHHYPTQDIISTDKILDNYASYVIDSGDHVNRQGSKLEAKWIKNHLSL